MEGLDVVAPLVSVAPMMERTDRHCRYFLRQISHRTCLYTEMVTVPAILHGDRDRLLGFSAQEHPLVLQLGGDNPATLARCAQLAAEWGYDAINLNVGCPSSRVQEGNFGACLMAQPERVAEAVAAMAAASGLPVTVKHRIGIDDRDRYDDMVEFVEIVASAGCRHFIVHARKAWLSGLDPKQNRTIPPLRYADVYRLKQEFPQLYIEINGGITTLSECHYHLQFVDAVMIGRAVYDNPYLLAPMDSAIYRAKAAPPSRHDIIQAMLPYVDHWVQRGTKLHSITRHMLHLFAGQPGSRAWKRHLTDYACKPHAGPEVLEAALERVTQSQDLQTRILHHQTLIPGPPALTI